LNKAFSDLREYSNEELGAQIWLLLHLNKRICELVRFVDLLDYSPSSLATLLVNSSKFLLYSTKMDLIQRVRSIRERERERERES